MGNLELFLQEMLIGLAQKHAVLLFMGTARSIFKPLMGAIEKFVTDTESKKDDEFLAKVKAHKAYLAVCWIMDYLASIKLPKKQ